MCKLLAREPGRSRLRPGPIKPGPHREGDEPKPVMHGDGNRRTVTGDRNRSGWSEGEGPRRTRDKPARAGPRAGQACPLDWTVYGQLLRRQTSKVGAGCGNAARPVLCGGCPVMGIPTAIRHKPAQTDPLSHDETM